MKTNVLTIIIASLAILAVSFSNRPLKTISIVAKNMTDAKAKMDPWLTNGYSVESVTSQEVSVAVGGGGYNQSAVLYGEVLVILSK